MIQNKTERITVRITKEDLVYLKALSYIAGMTPSEYLRVIVNATITSVKIKEKKGELKLDDIKAIFDDKL